MNKNSSETTRENQLESKNILTTLEERQEAAIEFISSLSQKPIKWKISGSTSRGDFRPISDLDIDALYEKDEDIPVEEIIKRMDSDNGLIDGFIDFHYFARNWLVFQQDPQLLKKFDEMFGTDP